MKFTKKFLKWEEWDETVYDKIVGHSRWSVHHEVVFRHDNKFYMTTYSIGATESQDESPYDYSPDEIECPEVFPVEIITIEYREKNDTRAN
jgi:hypothetical protein